VIDWNQEKN